MDVSVPLKDSTDEQLLAELTHRTLQMDEALKSRPKGGVPVGAWKPGNVVNTSFPPSPPRAMNPAMVQQQPMDRSLSMPMVSQGQDHGVLLQFAPMRAWVNGKPDDTALEDGEQVYVLKPDG